MSAISNMPLLLDSIRFNIFLWALITIHWFAGLWNFIACTPQPNDDECEILKYKKDTNYSSRLITSLVFFAFWVSQFRYPVLVNITLIEILLVLIIYVHLIVSKTNYVRNQWKKMKQINKERLEEIINKKHW